MWTRRSRRVFRGGGQEARRSYDAFSKDFKKLLLAVQKLQGFLRGHWEVEVVLEELQSFLQTTERLGLCVLPPQKVKGGLAVQWVCLVIFQRLFPFCFVRFRIMFFRQPRMLLLGKYEVYLTGTRIIFYRSLLCDTLNDLLHFPFLYSIQLASLIMQLYIYSKRAMCGSNGRGIQGWHPARRIKGLKHSSKTNYTHTHTHTHTEIIIINSSHKQTDRHIEMN